MFGKDSFGYLGKLENRMTDWSQGITTVQVKCMTAQPQFHVDNLSSAHLYLRLKAGESWKSIDRALLEDCAQLTKANSIDGRHEQGCESHSLLTKATR